MQVANGKIAIFADVQNIYYTTGDQFNRQFNYQRLGELIAEQGEIVLANAYAIYKGDDQQLRFQKALERTGFTVKLKLYIPCCWQTRCGRVNRQALGGRGSPAVTICYLDWLDRHLPEMLQPEGIRSSTSNLLAVGRKAMTSSTKPCHNINAQQLAGHSSRYLPLSRLRELIRGLGVTTSKHPALDYGPELLYFDLKPKVLRQLPGLSILEALGSHADRVLVI